jgi:hypothetical protein
MHSMMTLGFSLVKIWCGVSPKFEWNGVIFTKKLVVFTNFTQKNLANEQQWLGYNWCSRKYCYFILLPHHLGVVCLIAYIVYECHFFIVVVESFISVFTTSIAKDTMELPFCFWTRAQKIRSIVKTSFLYYFKLTHMWVVLNERQNVSYSIERWSK